MKTLDALRALLRRKPAGQIHGTEGALPDAEPLSWTLVKFEGDPVTVPWDGRFDPDRLPGEAEPVEIVKGGKGVPTTRWSPDGDCLGAVDPSSEHSKEEK